MNDLERVQPDPVKQALIQIVGILSDHLTEHVPELERDETFDMDMQALHDIRRRFVLDTYVDIDMEQC